MRFLKASSIAANNSDYEEEGTQESKEHSICDHRSWGFLWCILVCYDFSGVEFGSDCICLFSMLAAIIGECDSFYYKLLAFSLLTWLYGLI
jgi:hypothetical protein